jgi:hypothetical protein
MQGHNHDLPDNRSRLPTSTLPILGLRGILPLLPIRQPVSGGGGSRHRLCGIAARIFLEVTAFVGVPGWD